MAEWSQIENEKKTQLLDGIDSLVTAITEQHIFQDQIEPLQEIFEVWRTYLSYFKEEYPHEYQFWLQRWPDAPLD